MKNLEEVGKWSFILGLVVAVLAAFITGYATYVLLVLFVLGLVVGFLNVSNRDITKFLVALVALMLLGVGSLSALSVIPNVNAYLGVILTNFIVFVGAAGLVVSIKSIVETTKK